MRPRTTYTHALLDVSPEAYREIRAKLEAAGYGHAIDGQHIDMHGIALTCDPLFEFCWCKHAKADHSTRPGELPRCDACYREQQSLVKTGNAGNFLNCYHGFEDRHARHADTAACASGEAVIDRELFLRG